MPSEHDVDIDAVADAVVDELDPGSVINNKVVLSRRQALALASGTVGLGALVGTSDVASAQASGQVGTQSDPVDVVAYDLNVQNQLASNVDAGGNDISNVGSLSTGERNITSIAGEASLATNQTIPSGTDTQVNLDTIEVEDDSVVDVDLANDQIIAQTSGVFLIIATISFTDLPANDNYLDRNILINGSTVLRVPGVVRGKSIQDIGTQQTSFEELSTGDTISMRISQDTGSDQDIRGSADATSLKVLHLG